MAHGSIDLRISGTDAFEDFEGANLVLYVVHDRTTSEAVHELRWALSKQLAPKGRYSTCRLKGRHEPNADWS
jgi:hypothetical protein